MLLLIHLGVAFPILELRLAAICSAPWVIVFQEMPAAEQRLR